MFIGRMIHGKKSALRLIMPGMFIGRIMIHKQQNKF